MQIWVPLYSPGKRNPCPIPRRQRPTGERPTRTGELRNRSQGHTQTWKTELHTKSNTHTHTGPPQCQRSWKDGCETRVIFLQALTLFYLANEGARDTHAPFPADNKQALGPSDMTLTSLGSLISIWQYPIPGYLLSLAPAGEPPTTDIPTHTQACSLVGRFHSTSEVRHCFSPEHTRTGAKSELSEVPSFPFGDRSWD